MKMSVLKDLNQMAEKAHQIQLLAEDETVTQLATELYRLARRNLLLNAGLEQLIEIVNADNTAQRQGE